MFRCALEVLRLRWEYSVGCGEDFWVVLPHEKAAMAAAPGLGLESGLTVFGVLAGHSDLL